MTTILTPETPVTVGMNTYTMNMGKVVPVVVLEQTSDNDGWLGAGYLVKYTGTETVCLDFGQNWNLLPGDEFKTRKVNMDSALEWIAEKY